MPGGGTATGHRIGAHSFSSRAFAGSLGSAQSITGGAAAAVVDLDTEDLDTDAWYTPGSGSFQPDVAGMYLLIGSLTLAAFSGVVTVTLYRGATVVATVDASRVALAASIQVMQLVSMNGTSDAITMKVAHSDGSNGRNVTAATLVGTLLGNL